MMILWLLACAEEPATTTLVAVEWRLAWGWDDVSEVEGGWETTTADGHVVRVDGGRLGSAGASLVGCDPLSQAMLERDHGPEQDPSAWTAGRWDDLAAPEDFVAEPIAVDGGLYCDGHYAVAMGDEAWDGDGSDASFALSGLVTAPDGASWRFDAATTYSHGTIEALTVDDPELEGPIAATVTVVRPLAALFAEADLDEPDPDVLGWSLLGGLMHHTTFTVELEER